MPFPKIPLPGNRELTGHQPGPPDGPHPTLLQRIVSHLPLKVRARKPKPQLPPLPNELWLRIAGSLPIADRMSMSGTQHAFRQLLAPLEDYRVGNREQLKAALAVRPDGGPATTFDIRRLRVDFRVNDDDAELIGQNPFVQVLNLFNARLSRNGAIAVAKSSSIRDLYVSLNRLVVDHVAAFATMQLRKLDVSFNDLDPDSAVALAAGCRSLVELKINKNNLGDDGAAALARDGALPSLKHLDVSENGIGPTGTTALATKTSLQSLVISGNRIGDDGAKALGKLRLKSLTAAFAGIGDGGAIALADATIPKLDLQDNDIGDDGAKALAAATHLRELNLRGNKLTRVGREALEAVRHRFERLEL
jgi:hypothetical protein